MAWGEHLEGRSILLTVNWIATSLSLFGCFWTIIQFFKSSPPRSISSKLIFLVTLSDLVYTIANLLSMFESQDQSIVDGMCRFEAIIRFYSLKLTLVFSTCLAICCYKATDDQGDFDIKILFYRCLAFSIFVCVFFGLLSKLFPALTYVNGDYFCQFTATTSSDTSTRRLVHTVFEAIPAAVLFTITVIMYIKAVRNIRQAEEGSFQNKTNLSRLFVYPAVQFFTFLPALLDKYFSLSSEIFAFHVAHLFFTHGIGLSNALVYGIQQKRHTEKLRQTETEHSHSFLEVTFTDD